MTNPLEALKLNTEAQDFWQRTLDDPHFPVIFDALRAMIEQTPPVMPPTNSVIETMAMAQAAGLGAKHALTLLDACGAKAMGLIRAAEQRQKAAGQAVNPRLAGTGPGRLAMGTPTA